jgi:hypothetical protein
MMLPELPCWIFPIPSGDRALESASSVIVPVPEAVRLALTLISRCACRVSEFALDQLTPELTKMSPLPSVVPSVWMVTGVLARAVCRVVAPMPLTVCDADPALMVKSIGSISQLPPPVLGVKPSRMSTELAEVSMNPP